MTAPESEALAAWLDASAAVEDIPWPERAAKSRAAAAALRELAAERDDLMWRSDLGDTALECEHEVVQALRRKVARWVRKSRNWLIVGRGYEGLVKRQQATIDKWESMYVEVQAALAKARAAGWLT